MSFQNSPKRYPSSSKKNLSGEDVDVEYEWKETKTEILRIKRIDFRKGEEDLSGHLSGRSRDGADSICFKHNSTTYIMRKTVKEVAQALYNAYGKVKGSLENIVGYLKTVSGNFYVIAKAERDSWAFDRQDSQARHQLRRRGHARPQRQEQALRDDNRGHGLAAHEQPDNRQIHAQQRHTPWQRAEDSPTCASSAYRGGGRSS